MENERENTIKINLFDLLKSLTETKINLSENGEFESVYNPFMTNRFLSMHPSTTIYAHFVNKGNLSKKEHYQFLFYALPKEKIWFNYQKKEKFPDIKIIQKCFDISEHKAKEYSKILTKKQIALIKKKYGGKTNKST